MNDLPADAVRKVKQLRRVIAEWLTTPQEDKAIHILEDNTTYRYVQTAIHYITNYHIHYMYPSFDDIDQSDYFQELILTYSNATQEELEQIHKLTPTARRIIDALCIAHIYDILDINTIYVNNTNKNHRETKLDDSKTPM